MLLRPCSPRASHLPALGLPQAPAPALFLPPSQNQSPASRLEAALKHGGVEAGGELGGQAPLESASPVSGVQVTTHVAGAVRPIAPPFRQWGAEGDARPPEPRSSRLQVAFAQITSPYCSATIVFPRPCDIVADSMLYISKLFCVYFLRTRAVYYIIINIKFGKSYIDSILSNTQFISKPCQLFQ